MGADASQPAHDVTCSPANVLFFRDVNSRIESATVRTANDSEQLNLICECCLLECIEPLVMTLAEYRHVRSHDDWFVVRAGHEIAEGDAVVDTFRDHAIIRVHDVTGLIADDGQRAAKLSVPPRLRVVVHDDNTDNRLLIRAALALDPDVQILADTTSADELGDLCSTFKPHVVVMDFDMRTGMVPIITGTSPNTKVLMRLARQINGTSVTEYGQIQAPAKITRAIREVVRGKAPSTREYSVYPPAPGPSPF